MTPELKFSEFFEELGGIDNLRLMANLRDVEYRSGFCPPHSILPDTVKFTVGWEKQVTFSVAKYRSHFCPPIDEEFYYYVYISEYCWRLKLSEIRSHLSHLIKHHTGNEIFF